MLQVLSTTKAVVAFKCVTETSLAAVATAGSTCSLQKGEEPGVAALF